MSTDTSMPWPSHPEPGAPDAELVAALLRSAPIGFAYLDRDLRFRRVSDALARMAGLDPGTCVDRTPAQVWPRSGGGAVESLARRAVVEDRVVVDEQPVAAAWPDTLSCFPTHDGRGRVTGVVVLAGGRSSAETVRRSEERYRSLIEVGGHVVWVATPDGAVAEDSAEWRSITGQSVAEYLGDGWLAALHNDDRQRVAGNWRTSVRTGKVFDDSCRVRTRTGGYRHYAVRGVPVERGGTVVEWVGTCTDVTAQWEVEEMRGRLTEQLSAAALRTARLQQATSMLAEALTVEQVVEVITEVGRTAIGAQRSAVALLDRERLRLRMVGVDAEPPGEVATIALDAPDIMTKAITARRPVLVANRQELVDLLRGPPDAGRRPEAGPHAAGDAAWGGETSTVEPAAAPHGSAAEHAPAPDESAAEHAAATDAPDLAAAHPPGAGADEQSWVVLPLMAAGAPLGALRFAFNRPRTISEEERVFLEALGGQCALAVERAVLYEREHRTAETLQRSLLPERLPRIPGLVLEGRYLPVGRDMEIGGDWYDAFRLPDDKLAVTVGDVMGKGLTAAAGMGRVRNALRALALTDPRPAAVLTGLDRLFSATERDEQVATVAYLVIDPDTGEGLLGNAGHLPPLVLAPGEPPRLDATAVGTPLGWPSPRRQHVFALPPGATAVLYSDGLVENRRRGLDTGLDALARIAASAPESTRRCPERFLTHLVEAMLSGYEQDDDVTVLVLRRQDRSGMDNAHPAATYGGLGERAGASASVPSSGRESASRPDRAEPAGGAGPGGHNMHAGDAPLPVVTSVHRPDEAGHAVIRRRKG